MFLNIVNKYCFSDFSNIVSAGCFGSIIRQPHHFPEGGPCALQVEYELIN